MKIRVVSDLHLECLDEFGIDSLASRICSNPTDVLVLAGDICPLKSKRWTRLIAPAHANFDHIIWVPGNHEYYGSSMGPVITNHRRRLLAFPKVHFLNNQNLVIDNVNFVGSTLWSDFSNRNPLVMNDCQLFINDFHLIKYGRERRLTANDTFAFHQLARRWLFNEVGHGTNRGNINFVVTHFAPSWQSVHPRFKSGECAKFNGYYVTELSEEILDNKIHTWVHGHTHNNFDYMVGDTRVYANPHGYPGENKFDFRTDDYIEVING